jgi:hypothetical protein
MQACGLVDDHIVTCFRSKFEPSADSETAPTGKAH